ncbi:carbohydrate binding domain-containing protein [bacterium]|nr:carbohydrate binding domain-containing protein [bacterium]
MKRQHIIRMVIVVLTLSLSFAWTQRGVPLAKIRVNENGNVEIQSIKTGERGEANSENSEISEISLQKIQSLQSSQLSFSSDPVQETRSISGSSVTLSSGADLTYFNPSYTFNPPNLRIDVSVRNIGLILSGPSKIGFYLSEDNTITTADNLIGTQSVPALSYLGTVTKMLIKNISDQPGTYYVGIIVDYLNEVAETDESNNRVCLTPSIHNLPDLTSINSNYKYSEPNFSIDVEVKNIGFSNARSYNVGFYLSTDNTITREDRYIDRKFMGILNPDAEVTASFYKNFDDHAPPICGGVWYVGFIIDDQNRVEELNENNNAGFIEPPVEGGECLPDLDKEGILINDNTGPDIEYTILLNNNGAVSTGSSFENDIYLSVDTSLDPSEDYPIDSFTCPPISAESNGGPGLINTTISNVPAGEYWLGIDIDVNDVIEEYNETNNRHVPTFQKISVPAVPATYPDLTVTNVTVIDAQGPEISCRLTVKNTGQGATGGIKFKNRIYLSPDKTITPSDHLINDWNCSDNLASDQSKTSYDVPSTVSGVPAGSYYLGVIADAEQVILESNENNNTGYADSPRVTITDEGAGSIAQILEVPMAASSPIIDGNMDAIWYSVSSVPMEKQNTTDMTAPDNWLDCYASFKMMFDLNNYYLFIQTYDDQIKTNHADAYQNDSFDLFFDGDNSKNDQATGYDANDIQLRYMYGQTTENGSNAPNSTCKFRNTDDGYNLEIRIPASDMTFDLEADHLFGFEIQMNDNDTGSRDHMLKWWAESNDSWINPSLLGTARTTDYVASDPMFVLEATGAPTIDGSNTDEAWNTVPWFGISKYADRDNGVLFDPPLNLADVDGWDDCWFRYKMMWKGSMLYLYSEVYDNIIDISQPDWYMNDCFEIQIDGNNDKGQTTDSNDHSYNFVYSPTPASDVAFTQKDFGWTIEARMNIASDCGITPSVGHQMGMEVQVDDNDGGGRDLIGRWWSNDNITWTNPSHRGTIELAGVTVTDQGEPPKDPDEPAGNMVSNWSFSSGMNNWTFNTAEAGNAAAKIENSVFHAQITNGGANAWNVALYNNGLNIVNGKTYTVSFDARAASPRNILASVAMGVSPFWLYNYEPVFSITTEWRTYTFTFIMGFDSDPAARMGFDMGTSNADVYLDNISLVETGSTEIGSEDPAQVVTTFELSQNYPNPFNPNTTIQYQIPRSCFATLKIYDLLGREVATLVNEHRSPGVYQVEWNGQDASSGIYIVYLKAGRDTKAVKMILQK